MPRDESIPNARRTRRRLAVLAVALIPAIAIAALYLQATIPRHVVLASGVKDASYHIDAQRYAELLARDGVTVVERMTGGAVDNAALLLDPKSGVDVAFMEGGVVEESERDKIVMLASIRYEPVWVFYRGDATITRLDELRYKRLAVGRLGNGGRLIVEPLLKASNVTPLNTSLVSLGGTEALRALKKARAELAAGHLTRYLEQFEARLKAAGDEYFADRRLTVADLKVFMLICWLRSGVLDHIPKDLVDRVAPQLVKHFERVANHPKIAAYYQRRKAT